MKRITLVLRTITSYYRIAIIGLCCLPGLISAQDTIRPFIELTTTPSTLIDYVPRYRFATEVHITPRFSAYLQIGSGYETVLSFHRFIPETYLNYRFFEFRPELRYYYHRSNDKAAYFAVEGFSQFATKTLENSDYIPIVITGRSDVHVLYDRADLAKRKEGWHLKTGYKVIIENLITLDFYFGVGRAWRSFDYSNIVNTRIISSDELGRRHFSPMLREGIKNITHLTAGVHLGIIILNLKNPKPLE